jgi:NADH-quinone oxidoreductase subunit J
MNVAFFVAAGIAVLSTALTVTRENAVHALLYLIVSLLAVAVVFFTLGAPFVAALEVIIYAGAIMVLFLFAVMMLNLGTQSVAQERRWLAAVTWLGAAFLVTILFVEFAVLMIGTQGHLIVPHSVTPREVGLALYGPYLFGVELASTLLLSGLIGANQIGRGETR